MHKELLQISDHVWLYPCNSDPELPEPNIGIIHAESSLILIDAGNSPRHALSVKSAIIAAGLPRVDTIIYTHHHWDHTFGTSVFIPRSIVAHESSIQLLQGQYKSLSTGSHSSPNKVQDSFIIARNARIRKALNYARSFRLQYPDITFQSRMTLHFNNITLHLEHIGGIHAADSILVRVPEDNVIFVGDCYYPPVDNPPDAQMDITTDFDVLNKLVQEEADVLIDGHSAPFTPAGLLQMMNDAL